MYELFAILFINLTFFGFRSNLFFIFSGWKYLNIDTTKKTHCFPVWNNWPFYSRNISNSLEVKSAFLCLCEIKQPKTGKLIVNLMAKIEGRFLIVLLTHTYIPIIILHYYVYLLTKAQYQLLICRFMTVTGRFYTQKFQVKLWKSTISLIITMIFSKTWKIFVR